MDKEIETKERDQLRSLLELFKPLEQRLTPEVEPVTIYRPDDDR